MKNPRTQLATVTSNGCLPLIYTSVLISFTYALRLKATERDINNPAQDNSRTITIHEVSHYKQKFTLETSFAAA